MAKLSVQNYPRLHDGSGLLDDSQLVEHPGQMPLAQLKGLIKEAIQKAQSKSSREILSIPQDITAEEYDAVLRKAGVELFHYFKKYVGDPASSAHQIRGKHYRDVAREQFRNRSLQKERMNSGWRYQYLAVDCAQQSGRFLSLSDIGAAEGDFNAIIQFTDDTKRPLRLYVSVKNRSNTMGGQDWPKAIAALENLAQNDKNATGPYCCVFGIAMDRGTRLIKIENKTKRPYSVNTEVWLSDYFWPFFANFTYEQIMTAVLDVLMDASPQDQQLVGDIEIPEILIDTFGECCFQYGLLNDQGVFHDPYALVKFFVQPLPKIAKPSKAKSRKSK